MQLDTPRRNPLQSDLEFYNEATLPENKVLIKSGPQSKKLGNFNEDFNQAS